MNSIDKQVEEILKKKGLRPEGMSAEEFDAEVFKRLDLQMPEIIAYGVEGVVNEVVDEEMKRLGREKLCRHFQTKSKKCEGQTSCILCPNYRGVSRFRQDPIRYVLYAEALVFLLVVLTFVGDSLLPEIGKVTLTFWFLMVIFSRLEVFWLLSQMKMRGFWKKPKWFRVGIDMKRE